MSLTRKTHCLRHFLALVSPILTKLASSQMTFIVKKSDLLNDRKNCIILFLLFFYLSARMARYLLHSGTGPTLTGDDGSHELVDRFNSVY